MLVLGHGSRLPRETLVEAKAVRGTNPAPCVCAHRWSAGLRRFVTLMSVRPLTTATHAGGWRGNLQASRRSPVGSRTASPSRGGWRNRMQRHPVRQSGMETVLGSRDARQVQAGPSDAGTSSWESSGAAGTPGGGSPQMQPVATVPAGLATMIGFRGSVAVAKQAQPRLGVPARGRGRARLAPAGPARAGAGSRHRGTGFGFERRGHGAWVGLDGADSAGPRKRPGPPLGERDEARVAALGASARIQCGYYGGLGCSSRFADEARGTMHARPPGMDHFSRWSRDRENCHSRRGGDRDPRVDR